jgi:hypothetical protein
MSSERNHALAAESQLEHRRVARQLEVGERLARRAGKRIQRVGLAVLVRDVMEKRAELGPRELCGGVGDRREKPDSGSVTPG